MSEYLEAVSAGEIRRLIINIPPRYMKSIAVTVCWPVWEWITKPYTRWMFVSYSSALSIKHSVDRRSIITSDWYQKYWGDRYQLSSDQNIKSEYENTSRGVMVATSVGGTATGKGGNRIVLDDPINPQEAHSDQVREAANNWIRQSVIPTRLNDKKRDAVVIVMQRLHEQDTTGMYLQMMEEGGEHWEHLCVPAIAEKRTVITFPRSGRGLVREEGDLLWAAREGLPELNAVRASLGSYDFSGQYQQSPSPAEGGLFKREWWRFFTDATMPTAFDEVIQSWDMAFKDTKDSSYVCGQVWGRRGANRYLLDMVHRRMDFVETCKAVVDLSRRWPQAVAKIVEDKANGPAVISALRDQVGGLIPYNPGRDSKEGRAYAVSPQVEAGNVWIKSDAPWCDAFIDQCAKFPRSDDKDMVDAATQALLRFGTRVDSDVAPGPGPDPLHDRFVKLFPRAAKAKAGPSARSRAGW